MSDISGTLRRRWVLSLICLGLVLSGAAVALHETRPTFQSQANVLLLPPSIPRTPPTVGPDFTHGNPLFYLTGLDQTRDVLIGSLTSKETQASLGKSFPGGTFGVTPDLLNSSAVVVLTVKSGSAAETSAMLAQLLALIPRNLALVQAGLGVKPSAQITSHTLAQDPRPTVSHKSQIRRGIEVAGALGLLCLFLIAGIDSVLLTLKRRGRGGGDAGGPSDARGREGEDRSSTHRAGEEEGAPTAPEHPVTAPALVGWHRRAPGSDDATGDTGGDDDVREHTGDGTGETSSGNVRPLTKVSRNKRSKGPMGTGKQATSYRGRSR